MGLRRAIVNYIKATIISVLAILMPIKPLLIITSALIAIDTITGIIAALYTNTKLSSRAFARIIVKLLLYNLFIIACFLIENFVLLDAIPFTRIGVGIITLTELYSVAENLERATGISFFKSNI